MDANDKKYLDAEFKLIQARLTNIETQVTMLFNAEKKRMADAQGKTFQQIQEELQPVTLGVHDDLVQMVAALKARIEAEG